MAVQLGTIETQSLLPWAQPVTYTSVRNGGNVSVDIADAGVYRGGVREVQASFGVYTVNISSFTIRLDGLKGYGVTAKPRDTVTDADGKVWIVQDANSSEFLGFVKASAWALVIDPDLYESVTIRRATDSQDTAANRVPGFTVVANAVPGRVQPGMANRVERFGKLVTEVKYTVWTATNYVLTHEDQVLYTPTGLPQRILDVTGWADAQHIQDFQRIDCLWRGF